MPKMTDENWRYTRPPEKFVKTKAFLTAVFFVCLLGAVVFALMVSFGVVNLDETTTTLTTVPPTTATVVATTTTVNVEAAANYCEGWTSGQVFALTELGVPAEDAVNGVNAGMTNPCDVGNLWAPTPNEAWCEGFAEGFADIMMPYAGPPPHGWEDQAVSDCLVSEFYKHPLPMGGGGTPPMED